MRHEIKEECQKVYELLHDIQDILYSNYGDECFNFKDYEKQLDKNDPDPDEKGIRDRHMRLTSYLESSLLSIGNCIRDLCNTRNDYEKIRW